MSDPAEPRAEPGVTVTLALYTLARLALLAVIAGLLLLAWSVTTGVGLALGPVA